MRWTAPLLLLLVSCNSKHIDKPMRLGGEQISAATLNRGLQGYQRNCVGCHGQKGDGQAPTAGSMNPRPRDFTKGQFKFKSTPGDSLPTDDDLHGTLERGLRGTHMPSWSNLERGELDAIIQYIKTFSQRWRSERPGQPVPRPPDPWSGRRQEAVARGEVVYHAAARCWDCHPAYTTEGRIRAMYPADRPVPPFRGSIHRPARVDTSYGRLRAPDFLEDQLRVAWQDGLLYRSVAAGIGGTPMPSWGKQLKPRDLWAAVHYVRHLIQIKGTPRAKALRRNLGGP